MIIAKYFESFNGNDYFRDAYGNVYCNLGKEVAFCSVLKQGQLTENKAEPSYPVTDVELVYKSKRGAINGYRLQTRNPANEQKTCSP